MTRLGKMIFDDGREKGREEGSDRVNKLNKKLAEQNRMNDIIRASSDTEYQKKLFAEYQL